MNYLHSSLKTPSNHDDPIEIFYKMAMPDLSTMTKTAHYMMQKRDQLIEREDLDKFITKLDCHVILLEKQTTGMIGIFNSIFRRQTYINETTQLQLTKGLSTLAKCLNFERKILTQGTAPNDLIESLKGDVIQLEKRTEGIAGLFNSIFNPQIYAKAKMELASMKEQLDYIQKFKIIIPSKLTAHDQFKEGKLDGKRMLIFPDGMTFEGEFDGGILKGKGLLKLEGNILVCQGALNESLCGKGELSHSDGSSYKGDIQEGIPNGKGILKIDGDTYEGFFENGEIKDGRLIGSEGHIYEGEFKYEEPHGKGKTTFCDGTCYEGHFEDGSATGEGEMTFPDGKRYRGQFKDGNLQKGTISYSNGIICEGEFANHILNGTGKVIFPDGTIYDGKFEDGKLNGEGQIISSDGTIAKGRFENGEIRKLSKLNFICHNRKGKVIFPDGTICEGQFVNGNLNGDGKITLSDGNCYTGQFENGELIGKGKITSSDGDIGEWQLENGNDKIIFPDETIYEGHFEEGTLNGKGKITFRDGTEYIGTFKENTLVEGTCNQPYNIPPLMLPKIWQCMLQKDLIEKNQTGPKLKALDYQLKLMFGFSFGQRRPLTDVQSLLKKQNHSIEFAEENLPKIGAQKSISDFLTGEITLSHLIYIHQYLNFKNLKTEQENLAYNNTLNEFNIALERSIPFALAMTSITNQYVLDADKAFKKLSENIFQAITNEMKLGQKLLIPVGCKGHGTLLTLEKMNGGNITLTFYNTGVPSNHLQATFSKEAYYSKKQCPKGVISSAFTFHKLEENQDKFELMLVEIFKTYENKTVENIHKALNMGCTVGGPSKPRKIQINGVCSFQCLSAAIKDILGRENYIHYKIELLTQIQEDLTATITSLKNRGESAIGNIKNELTLAQVLLEDNQLAIANLKIKKEKSLFDK